ncbi:MAG: RiPP maturation radical SAM C-methyltransferase [Devosia sp.]|nr:RiPP maturation radical SAM C-methyltransferase [Devosia sp.]
MDEGNGAFGGRPALRESIAAVLSASTAADSDLVLICPPFASPDRPSLGLHVVAGVAREQGLRTCVLYANLSFARYIGPKLYRLLCHAPTEDLTGERLFALAYYGQEASSQPGPKSWEQLAGSSVRFGDIQRAAADWAAVFARMVAELDAPLIGASTVYEQTLASFSLLSSIKRHAPGKVTLLGGANADGPMGAQLADAEPSIDHVFVGEAEDSFGRFLNAWQHGRAAPRIVVGSNNVNLDALQPPDFKDFFDQFDASVSESCLQDGIGHEQVRLPYESSRGCWWGEKHHCTFCGLNASGMSHRLKRPEKVASEILAMTALHGIDRLLMVDNIMPHSYFSTLLPALARQERKLSLFYEQKANLNRQRMRGLKAAGVDHIQPGIESLSTPILKLMKKGVSAQLNIDCMRFARVEGVHIVWNLLCDFPGDQESSYEDMIDLIPLLHHLQPPTGVGGLSLDRFSPYHSDPTAYGISNLTALEAYELVFPGRELRDLAYHFGGEYTSAIRRDPKLHDRLNARVEEWKATWTIKDAPMLSVFEIGVDQHLVIDTRQCAIDNARLVATEEARLLIEGGTELNAAARRALDLGQMAVIDGRYGAIAMAPFESAAWHSDMVLDPSWVSAG